jgi:hypothetical protein
LQELTYAALLGGAVGIDALARPESLRTIWRATVHIAQKLAGHLLLACMTTALFGLFLAICGNDLVAAALTLALQALLVVLPMQSTPCWASRCCFRIWH